MTESIDVFGDQDELVSVCAADVKVQPLYWLWQDKFLSRSINVIAGMPKTGKSLFASAFMASHVSTGRAWPDGSPCEQGNVVIIQSEDGIEDTITPRLAAVGANMQAIHIIKHKKSGDKTKDFTFSDVEPLRRFLRSKGNVRLLIIDPVGNFCGQADTHRDSEVRDLLKGLKPIAEEFQLALVLVAHFNKSSGGAAITKVMGSMAFVGMARAAWAAIDDKDDPDTKKLVPIGLNVAPGSQGLKYKIQGAAPFRYDGQELKGIAQLVYCGVHDENADAALERQGSGRRGPAPTRRADAEQFLRDFLAAGPRPAAQVRADAKTAGISYGTLERAKERLGVRTSPRAPYAWRLCVPPPHNPEAPAA